MKLSVLGAAGATGSPLVEQALAAGHGVTALVRSGQKLTITNPNLHVVEGDATDRAAVSEAMNGGDAVISVLGARGPVMAEATRAIVDAAKQKGPERVVMLSSFAVARDRLTPVTKVDASPMLREILVLHKAGATHVGDDDYVFATRDGGQHNRNNVRCKMVHKAVERANAQLGAAGLPLITDGITNHSLRRTFASLLYEAGASPAYVMSQMGHTSAGLALEVYAKKMARSRDTGQRMDALIQAADWAQEGASESEAAQAFTVEETQVAS